MRAKKPPKEPRKKMSRTAKTLWTGALCIFIGVAGYTGYLYKKANDAIGAMSAPPPNIKKVSGEIKEKKNAEDPVTFLLMGIDSRPGSGGTLNTDTIMLAAWDPNKKGVTLLSIPRDTLLQPKGIGAHKANYFYAHFYVKDKETSVANTKQMFSETLGLPIDYMVLVDFNVVRDTVDLFGGLEIDVDMDMRYVDTIDGTNINLKQGLQVLDGKNTLDYLRYRQSNRGTKQSSDIERNARQQIVVEKLIDKVASFSGALKLGELLEIVGNNVITDIPVDTMRTWIFSAAKLKPEEIQSVTMQGTWDSPYILIQDEEWQRGLNALRVRLGLVEADLVDLPVAGQSVLKPSSGNGSSSGSSGRGSSGSTIPDNVYNTPKPPAATTKPPVTVTPEELEEDELHTPEDSDDWTTDPVPESDDIYFPDEGILFPPVEGQENPVDDGRNQLPDNGADLPATDGLGGHPDDGTNILPGGGAPVSPGSGVNDSPSGGGVSGQPGGGTPAVPPGSGVNDSPSGGGVSGQPGGGAPAVPPGNGVNDSPSGGGVSGQPGGGASAVPPSSGTNANGSTGSGTVDPSMNGVIFQ